MIVALLACSVPAVAQPADHEQAMKVAYSVVKSFMAAYDTRDPKAVAALFLPNAMMLSANGAGSRGDRTQLCRWAKDPWRPLRYRHQRRDPTWQ